MLRHFDQLTGNTLNQEEPASESKGKAKKKGFMDKLKETFGRIIKRMAGEKPD